LEHTHRPTLEDYVHRATRLGSSRSLNLRIGIITIPLFRDHKILSQVAGHASHTIKLLPSLVISNADCDWILNAFDSVIADGHRVPGAIWSLGKTLASHAMRAAS
jgi:ornithine--oxo-acid transaminase